MREQQKRRLNTIVDFLTDDQISLLADIAEDFTVEQRRSRPVLRLVTGRPVSAPFPNPLEDSSAYGHDGPPFVSIPVRKAAD